MNLKAFLLILSVIMPIVLIPNQKPCLTGSIPLKDIVINFDEEQIIAEIASYKKMDKELKITYIVAGAAVTIAAITGAVVLTVHFNQ